MVNTVIKTINFSGISTNKGKISYKNRIFFPEILHFFLYGTIISPMFDIRLETSV